MAATSKATLNCDMGESFGLYKLGDDDTLLSIIDLANVACGFHAGDPSVMSATVEKAKAQCVSVGAHPAFPDLQGFGRREMRMPPEEIYTIVMYQVGALDGLLKAAGMRLSHVKPHGSLYGLSSRDEGACRAIVRAVKNFGVPLVGLAGTCHERVAKEEGVPLIAEFFADLEYNDEGVLIITRNHVAVEPQVAAERTRLLLTKGEVFSVNKKVLNVHADTICIHSDTPGAVEVARAVRKVIDDYNADQGLGQQVSVINSSGERKIDTVLVANRGEIACRVIRTCKRLGIKTVAIYMPADSNASHVLQADVSVPLKDGDTYVSAEGIVSICKEQHVDAVHPGYGFLSENPNFSNKLEQANILFLGPSSDTMAKFGLKHTARELAKTAGVPVVPGTSLLRTADEAIQEAQGLGYPVMLKATGGGGGIGMQVCKDEADLVKAFQSCQRKAASHFSNPDLYMEKYYPSSRHIEVQVFGDSNGHVIHLGERECSVQRRNQKVIEETPSPFCDKYPQLRQDLCEAAVRLASLVSYRSAGTVEFLVVDDGSEPPDWFFLEMNTRLQVEHGITELVNNIDLVEWMILQAGGKLSLSSYNWRPKGHAIEVRVYAENPTNNFLPSPGLLTEVKWSDMAEAKSDYSASDGLLLARIDTWVTTGTHVTAEFDPLLAKCMVLGRTRKKATSCMIDLLNSSTVAGPVNNMEYLSCVLANDKFARGDTTTKILQEIEYTPMAVEVLQGGSYTSVQDWPGRIGLRVFGIQPSGPMDDLAFRVANLLACNNPGTVGLEMTFQGPDLLFHQTCGVGIAGAPMVITLKRPGQESIHKEMWSRFVVPAGSTLSIGSVNKESAGCRAYLAINGGISIPDYLGSKSTFPAFAYGGYQGRLLRPGDMLPLSSKSNMNVQDFTLPDYTKPTYSRHWEISVMPGPHIDPEYIKPEGMDEIFKAEWKVHYNSNRLGIRLVGPTPKWSRPDGGDGGSHPSNIHDCGYALGSVNFTGDQGVILTTEGPTQGGFTCPWTILSADLWKAGQLSPGDSIHFKPVDISAALQQRTDVASYLSHIQGLALHYPMPVPKQVFLTITNTSYSAADVDTSRFHGCAVLDNLPADTDSHRPAVQYLQAGDCYVMVEYGDPYGPLCLNRRARVKMLQDMLRLHTETSIRAPSNPLIHGTLDAAPSVRALLIRYDPEQVHQRTLVAHLKAIEETLPDCSKAQFPSREVHLPVAFDDHWCQAAVDQYMQLIRSKAAYLPSNVEFLASNNGLEGGKSEAIEYLLSTPQLVIGVGFYLGCPFAVPVDPRRRLIAPKYNPSRNFTPAGALGFGGQFSAIYPLESPGGYQLCGRTVPSWNTFGAVTPFTPHQPWLLNMFDQLIFDPVSEEKLEEYRRMATAGKYKYDIRDTTFDMVEHNKLVESHVEEVAEFRRKQKLADKKMRDLDKQLLAAQETEKSTSDLTQDPSAVHLSEGEETCCTTMMGCVIKVQVQPGDEVTAGDTEVCTLEAMKMEMSVKSQHSGTVSRVVVTPGQQIVPGDTICVVCTAKK